MEQSGAINTMSQSVTYFKAEKFVYLDFRGDIVFTNLSARFADWIIELEIPEGYVALMDLRLLGTVDRPTQGVQEFVNMQRQLSRKYATAAKMAILAGSAEAFVFGCVFGQISQEHIPTELEVFRSEQEALRFLGVEVSGLDPYLARLGSGKTLL